MKIIFIGDTKKRINEDYLRILRFFRFYAYYGKTNLNKKDLTICKNFSFLNTEIFPIPEKNYNIKKIINFREILSNKIKKLTQADATKQIYIFCINYYGIAMMRIFKTSGFKVKGFIDNNEMLNGKRILNIKISSPKILKKINKDKKKKMKCCK